MIRKDTYKLKEWWKRYFHSKEEINQQKWVKDNFTYTNGVLSDHYNHKNTVKLDTHFVVDDEEYRTTGEGLITVTLLDESNTPISNKECTVYFNTEIDYNFTTDQLGNFTIQTVDGDWRVMEFRAEYYGDDIFKYCEEDKTYYTIVNGRMVFVWE